MTSTTDTSSDVAGVQDTLDQVYQAWADNDGAAFAELYADDATVVLPGTYYQGKKAVAQHMGSGFAGPLKGSRGIDEPLSIRILGDTAIVVSRAGILMAGEDSLPAERERYATWVLTRRADRWLVAAYANAPAH
ncbi:SgcJ/EcaC family oxidoreductase [Jatrophihabitans sp.]|uniref:SgcJ/EcaC family oxidoreductase n=1 Tax=Jatrophihabitans sp. TaxID=1932789 RepID=UPI002D0F811F|nr:SgcJ/EcaC family oxidoreductase [Jatrophihabitans sp.]